MGFLGCATAIAASALLAVVLFDAPFIKSIYILKASTSEVRVGFNESVVFGTLGYCMKLSNGTTSCPKASVSGYKIGQFPFIPKCLITNSHFL